MNHILQFNEVAYENFTWTQRNKKNSEHLKRISKIFNDNTIKLEINCILRDGLYTKLRWLLNLPDYIYYIMYLTQKNRQNK